MSEVIFSKLRKELEKASLEIIRSRQYRGARESDYRAWLCDYVESNFVAKSDYDALKAKLEKAEAVISFYANKRHWDYTRIKMVEDMEMHGFGNLGGFKAREYLKGEG